VSFSHIPVAEITRDQVLNVILRRIRNILKTLVGDGLLAERGIQFNYGTTSEASYDFVHPRDPENPQPPL